MMESIEVQAVGIFANDGAEEFQEILGSFGERWAVAIFLDN